MPVTDVARVKVMRPLVLVSILVAALVAAAPGAATAGTVTFPRAEAMLRASDLTRPIWFPAASSVLFRGAKVRLAIGPGDRYAVRVGAVGGRHPSISFGRLSVYLIDVRVFCLARGERWRTRSTERHRFYVCSGTDALTVFFLRSNRLYDVATSTPSRVGERTLRHLAASFGPL